MGLGFGRLPRSEGDEADTAHHAPDGARDEVVRDRAPDRHRRSRNKSLDRIGRGFLRSDTCQGEVEPYWTEWRLQRTERGRRTWMGFSITHLSLTADLADEEN